MHKFGVCSPGRLHFVEWRLTLLLLLLLTAIGLSAGDSGYFKCVQNMKFVTNTVKSGGLHEKYVVALTHHLIIIIYLQLMYFCRRK